MTDGVVRSYSATECGWMRRRDLGPNVWELPDGTLRKHHNDSEPVIVKITFSERTQ